LLVVGAHLPAAVLEMGREHAGFELDMASQIEAISHVIDVAQNLRLRCVLLAPGPLLLQRRIELVGVLHALDVAARARVAVPEPCAADAVTGLEHANAQALLAQLVQHVQAAETSAHDDDIKPLRHSSHALSRSRSNG
jgi:hypothetical protein